MASNGRGPRWLWLLAMAGAGMAQTQASGSSKPGRVEGSVSHSITGDPIPKARVRLEVRMPDPKTPPRTYGALTGADGKFVWTAIEPGSYSLRVSARGFIGTGVSVAVTPDGVVRNPDLKLEPEGVISGRVVDGNGDPVEHAKVEFATPFKNAETDYRGEFRFDGIPAGQYTLRAVPQEMPIPAEIRTDGTREEAYQPTYYLSAVTRQGALPVTVRAGAETSGIEIRLVSMPVVRVSGAVTGVPPGADNVWVVFRREEGTYVRQAMVKNGKFAAWRLPPGKYGLDLKCLARDGRTFAAFPAGIEVAGGNVDNLSLDLVPEFELRGQVQWANSPPGGTSQQIPSIRLEAIASGPQSPGAQMSGKIDPDQTFRIAKAVAGRYRVRLNGGPAGVYVKSVVLDSHEMPDRVLELRSVPKDLTVVMGVTRARISGVVSSDAGPLAGATVELREDSKYGAEYGWRTCGPDGTYSFSAVPPGSYRLSVDGVELSAVEVGENDEVTRDLKVTGR